MLVYIIFYVFILLLSFKIKKNKFTFWDFVFIMTIILFSGLRSTGLDYFLYSKIFNNFNSLSVTSRTGTGFNYLMYFFKFVFHFNYQSMIFFVSFLTNLLVYYFIKKNSENPGLSMLIYISAGFYTTSFNMFRQSLSIALILFASYKFDCKKYLLSFICCLCAIGLHSSSLIAIAVYAILKKFKSVKFKMKYLLPIPIIGLLLYDKFFNILIKMSDSYSMYSTYNSKPGLGTFINVFVYIIITLFLIIPKYDDNFENKVKNYNNYNLFLIGVSIMLLELKNFLFFRIAFYFTFLSPIMLTDFYITHNIKKRKLENLLFYCCLFIYFLVYIVSFDGVLPYNLFFLKG